MNLFILTILVLCASLVLGEDNKDSDKKKRALSHGTGIIESGIPIGLNNNNVHHGLNSGIIGEGINNVQEIQGQIVGNVVPTGILNGGRTHTHTHTHTHTQNTRTHTVPYPVAQPYPVPVVRTVQVRVPQPYPVTITKSVAVPVPQPYPVPVPKPYPVTVTKHVPVPVQQPVYVRVPHPVQVPVPQPYPVRVPHIVRVPYPVAVPVHTRVETPQIIPQEPQININGNSNEFIQQGPSQFIQGQQFIQGGNVEGAAVQEPQVEFVQEGNNNNNQNGHNNFLPGGQAGIEGVHTQLNIHGQHIKKYY